MSPSANITEILDVARWAPSADNTQPWRFDIQSDECVVVHGADTRAHCVYDLDGRITQIALGALLETLTIAAAAAGRDCVPTRQQDAPDDHPQFLVRLPRRELVVASPLLDSIPSRTVQRRGMSRRPLSPELKTQLAASLGAGWQLQLIEPLFDRLTLAKTLFLNGRLRLLLPEAFPVHRDTVRWGGDFSAEGIPAPAVGLDAVTLWLTRWAMQQWRRVDFLNRYLAGTWIPCIELDAWPAWACAAQFAIVADRPLTSIDDYVAAGREVQRFWLTVTKLGLQFQPTVSPLVFARYHRESIRYTDVEPCVALGRRVSERLSAQIGAERLPRVAFMGRIGHGRTPQSRSLRLPLSRLLTRPVPEVDGSTHK